MIADWKSYPNFNKREFDCKATGANDMHPKFMERLQSLRAAFGAPLVITSGYRDPRHPEEAKKAQPGAHAAGRACDIAIRGRDAYVLIGLAIELGFTGIGIAQKGTSRYLHLDDMPGSAGQPRPTVWSY